MPRYHSLDTEVQLCTWDPLSCRSISLRSSESATQTPLTNWHPIFGSSPEVPLNLSIFNGETPSSGQDQSHKAKRLAEKYFKGHEGMDFLGRDTPFFLIHVGNDSSNIKRSSKPLTGNSSFPCQDHGISGKFSAELTETVFSRRSQILGKAPPSIPNVGSAVDGCCQGREDLIDVHSSSFLSNLSSTKFLTSNASNIRSEEHKLGVRGRTFATVVTPEEPKRNASELETLFKAPELETVSKPIEVVVKLSEKSFMRPILGTESDRFDICINIFYNGEFSTSQIIKYSAWALHKNENRFDFGGRRIGTGHEIPWMITTRSKDAHSTTSQMNESSIALTPSERWNKLAEMLTFEANKWGSDERGNSCSIGQYLELLSRKAVPAEIDGPQVNMRSDFGVIDVVITFGRVFYHDAAKEISSPYRYLSTSQPLIAHSESKISTSSLARAMGLSKAPLGLATTNGLSPFAIEVEPEGTLVTSSHHGNQIISGVVAVTTSTADVTDQTALRAKSQVGVRLGTSLSVYIPAPAAIVPIPRPPHPNRPKNIPQKTYRGSEPSQPSSPPSKLRKTANLFEELPFDLNTAAYMSTRARRSASMPFAQTPTKPQAESSFKRKRSEYQAKSTLSNTEISEVSMAGTLLPSEQDEVRNPKTPESDSPLKKKPRSSIFNAKLSNRPQNLRRKNSAGEWIIPPCRRNSAGEWETPTRGGKFKTAGDLGGPADGAVKEESGKTFQPVSTDSADIISRDMEIGPNVTHQILPDGDKVTLKENEYLEKSAKWANRLAPTVAGLENKKEDPHSKSSGRQSIGVTIPGTSTSTMISPPEVIFRGIQIPRAPVRGSPNRDIVVISPPLPKKIAFEDHFPRMEEGATIVNTKHTHRRGTLRMRFFEGNINPPGEIIGDACGTRRWLVRRYTISECIPVSDSEKQLASFSLFQRSKLKLSFFGTGPQGEKVTDDSTNSATSKSRRKPETCDTASSAVTNKLVSNSLRASGLEAPQKPRFPALIDPRPRFVVPDHNSRVLKLLNWRPVAVERAGMKQEARSSTSRASGTDHADGHFKGDTTYDSDKSDAIESPILAKQNSSRNRLRQDTKLKVPDTPQSRIGESIVSSAESSMILAPKKDMTRSTDLEARNVQGDQASAQMPAGWTIPKRPFRKRTVGSTELKALLESHDRHNITNTSLDASLGILHSQTMTRASRNALSSKGSTNKPDLRKKNIVQRPVSSNSILRKRSSSGHWTLLPKHTRDVDGGIYRVMDTQTNSGFNSGASNSKVKNLSSGAHKTNTPNPTTTATMECDLNLLGAGELSPGDNLATMTVKETISGPQKVLKIQIQTVQDLGRKPDDRADKVEKLVDSLDCPSDDDPTLRHQGSKDALKTEATNTLNLEHAAGEVDVALKQMCRAKLEINKAAGDLQSLTTRASTQRVVQKMAMINVDRAKASPDKKSEESVVDMQRTQEQNLPTPTIAATANTWKPGCICDDSILTYAKNENWDDLERNSFTGQICRRVRTQEDGYFKTFGVLMGVRYVVAGSAEVKD